MNSFDKSSSPKIRSGAMKYRLDILFVLNFFLSNPDDIKKFVNFKKPAYTYDPDFCARGAPPDNKIGA
jgi:hypothetical protein